MGSLCEGSVADGGFSLILPYVRNWPLSFRATGAFVSVLI